MKRRDFLKRAAGVSLTGAVCGCASSSADSMPHGLIAGDSIAWQYARSLRENLAEIAMVESIATPGNTTERLRRQLELLRLGEKKWDFVILNGAWNDLRKLGLTPFSHWQRLQDVITEAERLVERWFWVSTTPISEAGSEELRTALNDAAYGTCTRRLGAYIPGGEFVFELGDDVFGVDGLHLNTETARLMGEYIALEVGGRLRLDACNCGGEAVAMAASRRGAGFLRMNSPGRTDAGRGASALV